MRVPQRFCIGGNCFARPYHQLENTLFLLPVPYAASKCSSRWISSSGTPQRFAFFDWPIMTQEMSGLLIDSCTNVTIASPYERSELLRPDLYPPTGGEQTSNVVITGDSSNIVFKNMPVSPGQRGPEGTRFDRSINQLRSLQDLGGRVPLAI